MRRRKTYVPIFLLPMILLAECSALFADDAATIVRFNVIQMNDVYEINPFGKNLDRGGLAQVAGFRKRIARRNWNTMVVLAGDLLSPSPMGSLPPSAPWKGKQIVDVMNVLGLDLAVLGNHEFDVGRDQFLNRINESRFPWISANVFNESGAPFPNVGATYIREFRGLGGASIKVGFLGLTIDSNTATWVRYTDPINTARRELNKLKNNVDLIIGLTHLELKDDLRLAEACPEIHVIMGGHEHDAHNYSQTFPNRHTARIFKADSNSSTVWHHEFAVDASTRRVQLNSRLIPIDGTVKEDPDTAFAVSEWNNRYEQVFIRKYPNHKPSDVVRVLNFELQGRDALTRTRPTNLGILIAKTMLATLPETDPRPKVALLNSGSIRIDDNIAPGNPIRVYDVQRILPFGGPVVHVQMSGALIRRLVTQSEATMKSKGGYLQYSGLRLDGSVWKVGEAELDDKANYLVALSDYLFKGSESGFEYLNANGKLVDGMKLEAKQPPAEDSDVQRLVLAALRKLPPDDPEMTKAVISDSQPKCDPTATIEFHLDPPSHAVEPKGTKETFSRLTSGTLPPTSTLTSYPGVYLEEIAAGVKSINGVLTSSEKSGDRQDDIIKSLNGISDTLQRTRGNSPTECPDCGRICTVAMIVISFVSVAAMLSVSFIASRSTRHRPPSKGNAPEGSVPPKADGTPTSNSSKSI